MSNKNIRRKIPGGSFTEMYTGKHSFAHSAPYNFSIVTSATQYKYFEFLYTSRSISKMICCTCRVQTSVPPKKSVSSHVPVVFKLGDPIAEQCQVKGARAGWGETARSGGLLANIPFYEHDRSTKVLRITAVRMQQQLCVRLLWIPLNPRFQFLTSEPVLLLFTSMRIHMGPFPDSCSL